MSIIRKEADEIIKLIPESSRVLDLGCGDGMLLARLKKECGCEVRGVELDRNLIASALSRGVPVLRIDLNRPLSMYEDNSFDVVILSQTLKELTQPARVLREVLRVGKVGIVSYPNFANFKNRTQLFFGGRMPVSRNIPASWYETSSIHHTTIGDFEKLVNQLGGRIRSNRYLKQDKLGRYKVVTVMPHLRAETVISIMEQA